MFPSTYNVIIVCYSYQETPASSNRSSPTITEELPGSSIVHGDLWATGNTTERSSVDSNYSWDVSVDCFIMFTLNSQTECQSNQIQIRLLPKEIYLLTV